MAIVPSESLIEEPPVTTTAQATLSEPESKSPIGRVLAPVRSTASSPPPRPQGSSDYSTADFPMEARDVDAEIDVHFDITGQSTTEGRLSDIQSCFRSRLTQIRDMMLTSRTLPRRPMSNVEAWRNRQRHNSKDYEVTIVGLVSEVRWTRPGNLKFVIEDETAQISCLLKPPSDASPLHASLDGLMDDEIIGASGYFLSGDRDPVFWARDIHKPPWETTRRHRLARTRPSRPRSSLTYT